MKKCRVPNYSKDLHSNMINLSKLESSNVDELIEDVYSVLQGVPFSTDIDESIDEETYTDSIDALVKQVGVELSKANLPFELSTQDKARITRSLKTKLLPRPLTKAEQQISAIINGTDLVREEDIQQIKYKSKLRSLIQISEPTRLLSNSYAVFCLKKKINE